MDAEDEVWGWGLTLSPETNGQITITRDTTGAIAGLDQPVSGSITIEVDDE